MASRKLTVFAADWANAKKASEVVWDRDARFRKRAQEIRCLAFDEAGQRHVLRFQNVPVYVYLELPRVSPYGAPWTESDAAELVASLVDRMKDQNQYFRDFPRFELAERDLLHFYDPANKHGLPFVRLWCHSTYDARQVHRLLEGAEVSGEWPVVGGVGVELRDHESSIDAVRRMLSLRRMTCAGWMDVSARRVPEDQCVVKARYTGPGRIREWVADWTTIEPRPDVLARTHPLMAVFDIEAISGRDIFPNAVIASDCVSAISLILEEYGKPETRENMLFTTIEEDLESSEVSGATRLTFATEVEMLTAFFDAIRERDPDVLSGYNVDGFDWPYLYTRMAKYGLEVGNIGRYLDDVEASDLKSRSKEVTNKDDEVTGVELQQVLSVPGRILFDLIDYARKEFKWMRSFTLEAFAQEVLGAGKLDVDIKQMFVDFREHKGLRYKTAGGKTALRTDADRTPEERERWLVSRRTMTRYNDYCIIDSVRVMEMLIKLNIWTALCEFSAIMCITIEELYTRGEQIRVFNNIVDACMEHGFVLDRIAWDKLQVAGAMVQKPIEGLHDGCMCLDFASLYPSIMIAFNICFSTLIPQENYKEHKLKDCWTFEIKQLEEVPEGFSADEDTGIVDLDAEDEEDETDEIKYAEIETVAIKKNARAGIVLREKERNIRFVRQHVRKGLLPRILEKLLEQRRITRKVEQVKFEEGSFEWNRLEQRQLALKITANATYGFCGAQKRGILPLPLGFICVTTRGRQLIQTVNAYLEKEHGATIVYGDTDSTMFTIPGVSGADCKKVGKKIEAHVAKMFPPPIRMEYEKGMRILMFKKKMYCYYKISDAVDENGVAGFELNKKTGRPKLIVKGIKPARRDNCAFQKEIYLSTIVEMLDLVPAPTIMGHVAAHVRRMLAGELPLSDFTVSTKMGVYAADSTAKMRVLGETMKALHAPITPGDRVEYIVRDMGGKMDKVSPLMIEYNWCMQQPEATRPRINVEYYLSKGLDAMNFPLRLAFAAWADTDARKACLGGICVERKGSQPLMFEKKPMECLSLAVLRYAGGRSKPDLLDAFASWLDRLLTLEKGGAWSAIGGTPAPLKAPAQKQSKTVQTKLSFGASSSVQK